MQNNQLKISINTPGWISNRFSVRHRPKPFSNFTRRNTTTIQEDDYFSIMKNIKDKDKNLTTREEINNKPTTAPHGSRHKPIKSLSKKLEESGKISKQLLIDDQFKYEIDAIGRYKNFRTTISNKKQLLFLRPYMRNSIQKTSVDKLKTEIYKSINHSVILENENCLISYMTQYTDDNNKLEHNNSKMNQIEKVKNQRYNNNRITARKKTKSKSINILKEKLKNMNQPSSYKKRINLVGINNS